MSQSERNLRVQSQTGPAYRVAAVTPDDAADLPGGPARSLFVGVGGVVALVDGEGNAVELVSADSQYHPIYVSRVRAAGTTAGSILALY
jgi:hypothetical protein